MSFRKRLSSCFFCSRTSSVRSGFPLAGPFGGGNEEISDISILEAYVHEQFKVDIMETYQRLSKR